MDNDAYLNLAVELYQKGNWSEEVFIKRVSQYAVENGIDKLAISELFKRVIKKKEYTIDEKRNFLSYLKFDNDEAKYGDAVEFMTDEMIEKFYELEVSKMDEKTIEEYHKLSHEEIEKQSAQVSGSSDLNNSETNEEHAGDTSDEEQPQEEVENGQNVENSNVDGSSDSDMPESEEEFQEQAQNITGPEEDSSVKQENASPERIEKLKKSKGKVKSFFIKSAIVVSAVLLLNPVYSIGGTLGYLYFANEIKNGRFNPKNPIGQAVKHVVEKVMNLGMPKDKEKEEGGKTK